MNEHVIRVASADDAAEIQRIYAPAVRNTAASFELEPPDIPEIQRRIAAVLERHPWLVFERDGEVLGYAYAGTYRTRTGYQWSTEVSVYVDQSAWRVGVARALYRRLFSLLVDQGYFNAYAVITLPNPASVALHESMGFAPIGVFHNVGFKFGRWHDVGWWQRTIQPHHASPAPPLPFSQFIRERSSIEQ